MTQIPEEIDALLEKMIVQQRAKVFDIACSLCSRITQDDLLNPQDFPELAGDLRFGHEDGVLTGLLSAQISVRAEFRREAS